MSFERAYYEAPEFWQASKFQDAANQRRFEVTTALIPAATRSLLDVGSGDGSFLRHVAAKSPQLALTAVDRSLEALSNVGFAKMSAEITKLPFAAREFDCVSCLQVLEHLSVVDFPLALDELTRVAGRHVVVSVPYDEKLEDSHTQCPQCRSIFNRELHLRSFDRKAFLGILGDRGFVNTSWQTCGEMVSYKFHATYTRVFYPEAKLRWNSPICPICGFSEPAQAAPAPSAPPASPAKRRLVSRVSWLPKLFWPKVRRDYWIMGLFTRV